MNIDNGSFLSVPSVPVSVDKCYVELRHRLPVYSADKIEWTLRKDLDLISKPNIVTAH